MSKVCLSFDVEEWSLPKEYGASKKYWDNTSYSKEGVKKILSHLKNQKCTFFVTGFFADREPEIIKMIIKSGHEVASHSYFDKDHSNMTLDEFYKDILKSKHILESITKMKVLGLRVPRFSQPKGYLEMVEKAEFKYDSSFHPAIVPGHYYNFFMKRKPFFEGKVLEIPVSVIPIIRFPVSWIWMRLFGSFLPKIGGLFNNPLILYFHPWEFVNLPKLGGIPNYLIKGCGTKFMRKVAFLNKSSITLGEIYDSFRDS